FSGRSEPGGPKLSKNAWLGWLIIIGSLPVGTIGLALKKLIEGPFTKNLWVIATMMIVVGILLLIAEIIGKRERDMDQLRVSDALAVGSAQVLALIPGSRRSRNYRRAVTARSRWRRSSRALLDMRRSGSCCATCARTRRVCLSCIV